MRDFNPANVHFESKPNKVVGEQGDYFLDVGPEFKDKYVIIYIEHAE